MLLKKLFDSILYTYKIVSLCKKKGLMQYKYVSLTVSNRIAYITLNRPEKRNALNAELVQNLKDVFLKVSLLDDVKVVV